MHVEALLHVHAVLPYSFSISLSVTGLVGMMMVSEGTFLSSGMPRLYFFLMVSRASLLLLYGPVAQHRPKSEISREWDRELICSQNKQHLKGILAYS